MQENTLSQQTIFDAAQPVSEDYEEKIKNLNAARIAAGTARPPGTPPQRSGGRSG